MATQNPQRDNSQQPNRGAEDRQENMGNSSARPSSLSNRDDESISTAGDTSDGKGSKTGIRKEDKEASDTYDKDRS